MKKIIEGVSADVELEKETESILQDLESWVDYTAKRDFHSIDLFKSGKQYFLMVNFGLIKAIWELKMSELRQLQNKETVEDVAGFIESMTNEPIIDRSGWDE